MLVETGVFNPEDTVTTQPKLQEVVNVRVQPRGAWNNQISVYVTGTSNFVWYKDEVAILDSVESASPPAHVTRQLHHSKGGASAADFTQGQPCLQNIWAGGQLEVCDLAHGAIAALVVIFF